MGLKKLAEKVEEYNERLDSGKASKIKPKHVEKVLEKLRRKTADLEAELAEATSDDDRERLATKLAVARTHTERAEWLLKELG